MKWSRLPRLPFDMAIEWDLGLVASCIELPSKSRIYNHQPQWEREKKQFRSVDPYGKPLPRELIRVRKPVPLWRTYHPLPKRR